MFVVKAASESAGMYLSYDRGRIVRTGRQCGVVWAAADTGLKSQLKKRAVILDGQTTGNIARRRYC